MTHSPEKEHPQCNEKCECSAISSNEVIGDSEKAINNNHLTVGKEHHSEFVDLFFVAFIFILFEQVAAVILDKLSLLSNMAVRDTVQAILFLFVAIVLNVKYPLDIRQSDRRLLSNFTLIGIGFCIFRYMPYFNSLMNNHKINDIYASYLALHGLQYWWSIALLIVIIPFIEEVLFRGFLFRLVMKRTNMTFAVIISSVVFTSVHGIKGGYTGHFLLGVICCYVYTKSKTIWASIFTHIGNNAIWYICTGYILNKF